MNARRATTSLLALAGAIFSTAAFPPAALAAEPVGVVTSIKPVHSLVAGVMQGVAEPTLLVKGAASPHSFSLRPSDARALNQADLVFWVGEDMETFLAKPIESLGGKANVTALMEAPASPCCRPAKAAPGSRTRRPTTATGTAKGRPPRGP